MVEKFLITGGEGFIGRNLKALLIEEGKEVRTLDIEGKPDFKMSITDFDSLMSIDERFDGVFHLAATTAPPQFEEDSLSGFDNNANGTLKVLEFAKRKGIPKVILASSSAVYGDNNTISVENNVPDRYSNLYPVTKILNEYLARYYSIRGEVECISLRYFNTYGSGENTKGAYASPISKFLKAAIAGDPIIVYGDGTQRRDFIYVKDSAKATWLAFLKGKAGESYNVGTGISTNYNDIAILVKTVTNSTSEIKHIPNPLKSYQMFTQADMKKTSEDLGFVPAYNLERAVREMIEIEAKP